MVISFLDYSLQLFLFIDCFKDQVLFKGGNIFQTNLFFFMIWPDSRICCLFELSLSHFAQIRFYHCFMYCYHKIIDPLLTYIGTAP